MLKNAMFSSYLVDSFTINIDFIIRRTKHYNKQEHRFTQRSRAALTSIAHSLPNNEYVTVFVKSISFKTNVNIVRSLDESDSCLDKSILRNQHWNFFFGLISP